MAYSMIIYECLLLLQLLHLQLISCEVRSLRTSESNCSVPFFSNVQVNTGIISQDHEIFEDHLYSNINYSVFCSISNELDLTWHFCVNENCTSIKKLLPHDVVHCSPAGNLSVLDCYCVTYNTGHSLVEIGNCIYNCEKHEKSDLSDIVHHNLPRNASELNELTCGNIFNRNGTLCGKCKDGYFPQVYSFNLTCVKCPHGRGNWWKFVLSAFLPLTIFYFIVVFFKINTTSSHLHGFIFYSQIISLPQIIRVIMLAVRALKPKYLTVLKYFVTFCGIWNLDFFRAFDLGICLGTGTLQTLSLDIVVGIYPLLLMVLSYVLIDLYDRNFRLLVILWKPFKIIFSLFHRNWEIRTSVIDAYATFFLLSNVKFLSISLDLLAPVKVYQLSSSNDFNYTWQLYYDASVPYFSEAHLPYAILAICILFFFVLLPVLLLILYPCSCFQKLLNMFPLRWYRLHTFIDLFHGCYKNGTEPESRDCRWFASSYFIIRFILSVVGGFTYTSTYFVLISVVLILFIILLVIVEPFKANLSHYTTINAIFFLILASWYVSVAGINVANVHQYDAIIYFYYMCILFAFLPVLYASVFVLYWIFNHRKFGFELVNKLFIVRQGYRALKMS